VGLGDGAHLLDWCNSPHSGKFCFSPISDLVGNLLGLREASTYPLSSAVAFCRLAVLSFSCLLVCFVSPVICRSVSVSAPSLKGKLSCYSFVLLPNKPKNCVLLQCG